MPDPKKVVEYGATSRGPSSIGHVHIIADRIDGRMYTLCGWSANPAKLKSASEYQFYFSGCSKCERRANA